MIKSTKNIHVVHQDDKFVILSVPSNKWYIFNEDKSTFFIEDKSAFFESGESINFPKGSKWIGRASEILDAYNSKELLSKIKMTYDEWSSYCDFNNLLKTNQVIYLGDIKDADVIDEHIDSEIAQMERNNEAIKISKQIQKKLYQLHELGYSLDSNYSGIHIFDNSIEPEKATDVIEEQGGLDCQNQIIYTFNLGAEKK